MLGKRPDKFATDIDNKSKLSSSQTEVRHKYNGEDLRILYIPFVCPNQTEKEQPKLEKVRKKLRFDCKLCAIIRKNARLRDLFEKMMQVKINPDSAKSIDSKQVSVILEKLFLDDVDAKLRVFDTDQYKKLKKIYKRKITSIFSKLHKLKIFDESNGNTHRQNQKIFTKLDKINSEIRKSCKSLDIRDNAKYAITLRNLYRKPQAHGFPWKLEILMNEYFADTEKAVQDFVSLRMRQFSNYSEEKMIGIDANKLLTLEQFQYLIKARNIDVRFF